MKTNNGIKGTTMRRALLKCALLVLTLTAMPTVVQAQVDYDYSGVYYIANRDGGNYRSGNPSVNYYLCPSTSTYNENMPFATTYKTNKDANSKWRISFVRTEGGKDYYTIYHIQSEKYLTYNEQLVANNDARVRLHLQSSLGADDKSLFYFTPSGGSYVSENNYNIVPKVDASARSLNPAKNNFNYYEGRNQSSPGYYTNWAGQTVYCGGLIGLWDQNDQRGLWYLEDAIPRPTFAYNTSNLLEITANSGEASPVIRYTTDGTDPSATVGNIYTAPFDPNDDVTVIKAVEVLDAGTGETTKIAVYNPPVLCGTNHKRLIQSHNNAWSTTNFHFYLIPGNVNSTILEVNTTSLFRPTMEWYFLSAGVDGGVQYYYIVNNENGKYLCSDNTAPVHMETYSDGSADKFKYSIVEAADGTYNIKSKTAISGNSFVQKNSGNDRNYVVNLSSSSSANSQWKFIKPANLNRTAPFDGSVPSGSYNYYKIKNVGGSNYIIPVGEHAQLSTEDADDMKWYFEKAEDASASDWLTYYYIRNAVTGDYLYFLSGDTNARINSTITPGNEVRYKFTWARSATDGNYYIIPKYLKDKSQNEFCPIYRKANTQLQARNTRLAGDYAWMFESSSYTCATPTIEWSDANGGGYVIRSAEPDARKWYTTNDELSLTTSSGTAFDIAHPIQVADLDATSVTIRAITARDADGNDVSSVASLTAYRVATPGMTLLDDGTVQLTCATDGATFYYTMANTPEGVATPTTGSTEYTGPIMGAAGKYIKVIAVKDGWINSEVFTSSQIKFTCAKPIVRKASPTTVTIECTYPTSGVHIYYTIGENHGTPADPTDASTEYTGAISFVEGDLPFTVKAIAYADGYNTSAVATKIITANLNDDEDGYYVITNAADFDKFIMMVNGDDYDKNYKITADITLGDVDQITNAFTGELKGVAKGDGTLPVVSGLKHAMFNSINGGRVHDLMFDDVDIPSGGTNVGAICNEATGATRIYNCGILSGTVTGSNYVGSFVGLLDGSARVINCFSYANITGGTVKAGIVGYNNYASKSSDVSGGEIRTMVMNCMFYGNLTTTEGTAPDNSIYPIYGGTKISNANDSRLNNYNYFLYEAAYSSNRKIPDANYNCALSAERRFLVQFEFYRNLLNSTRDIAAWYATGSTSDAHTKMLKWVLDKSVAPYPILKVQGSYPSVVNYDPTKTYDSESGQMVTRTSVTGNNKGRATGTLTVNITAGSGRPAGAAIKPGMDQITLMRTDKDFDDYNYNYDKVQLPYYNEVGTKNCTGNKVVTGWKITGMTGGTRGKYTAADQWKGYDFADRSTYAKDLYSGSSATDHSGRVFSQGAYFDVPAGVTEISIEPYWATAVYLSDSTYDMYGYAAGGVKDFGMRYTNNTNYTINGSEQKVYTSIGNAVSALTGVASPTVYDYAVVLVGNYHHSNGDDELSSGSKPFTITSIDLNEDNEPDYSLIYRSGKQKKFCPIRFDFINVPGAAMAHKTLSNDNMGIPGNTKMTGWFEITNTALIHYAQFEYDSENKTGSDPVILLGGVIEQFVSTNGQEGSVANTKYIHVGSNVWFKLFNNGCHMDKKTTPTPHIPISVTGGSYDEFYLSGYFQPEAPNTPDNAECYIDGGYFGDVAGAGQEKIDGNVTWYVNHAYIENFYGGGINVDKPITGHITDTIMNSHIGVYCGGPKFGNVQADKNVNTYAENSTFGTYYGAGNGGTAFVRKIWSPGTDQGHNRYTLLTYPWNDWLCDAESDHFGYVRGHYIENVGFAADYEAENFEGSNNKTVARLYIKYASLSLAETKNVSSKLEGCTVEQNFYGGGKLGAVNGNAVSELNNCTVYGNVFGAGYSASVPTVNVYPAVSKVGDVYTNCYNPEPKYNSNTGQFEAGVRPEPVEYTWSSAGSNGSPFTDDGDSHEIHTDEDLDDLGKVLNNVTLTLKGNTTVGTFDNGGNLTSGGNVYGGGDESAVTGNTTVNLQDNTHVGGNVFGGGNRGTVSGSSSVTIQNE